MLFKDDSALAAALRAGQNVRVDSISCVADWMKDGRFAHPHSDLSDNVDSVEIDRQTNASYPDELTQGEGYTACRCTVILSGSHGGVPVWRLFSPFNNDALGSVNTTYAPIKISVSILDANGVVKAIPQFTGYVLNVTPSRKNSTVTLEIGDLGNFLTQGISIDPYAHSQADANAYLADSRQGGSTSLGWFIVHTLRQAGVKIGPRPHPSAVAYWTLIGGARPEIGQLDQMSRYYSGNDNDTINQDSYANQEDYDTVFTYSPSKYPWYCYEDHPVIGAVRLRDVYGPNGNSPDSEGSHYTLSSRAVDPLRNQGDQIIGASAWVKITDGPTNSRFLWASIGMKPTDQQVNDTTEFGLAVDFNANQLYGLSQNGERFSGPSLTVGDHFVAVAWIINAKTWRPIFWVDGQVVMTGAALAAPAYNGRAFLPAETNPCFIQNPGGAAHVQIWHEMGTTPTWPDISTDRQAVVRKSYGRVFWNPRVEGSTAWDLLKDLCIADCGTMTVDELGLLQYWNIAHLQSMLQPENSVQTLTLDDIDEIDPVSRFSSVANVVRFSSQDRVSVDQSVWKASNARQFVVPAQGELHVSIPVGDVHAVMLGRVTFRPHAVGAKQPNDPNYTPGDIMKAYNPEFYKIGFTPANANIDPNSVDQTKIPPIFTGVNAYVSWAMRSDGVRDTRFIKLDMYNSNTNPAIFATYPNTPFLNVRGYQIVDGVSTKNLIQADDSVRSYGSKVVDRAQNEWATDYYTGYDLASMLLSVTKWPRPLFSTAKVTGDPRRQLLDVLEFHDADGMGGPIWAAITGISRKISVQDGIEETLTMRTIGPTSASWILDDPDYSILDQTTVLSDNR